MNLAPHIRSRALTVFLAAGLFALNAWICRELFHIEYLRFMGSIECAYFAIARFILAHPHDLKWFPLWYEGIPYQDSYPPLLSWMVALWAWMRGWSPALAYHFVTAILYCLGPVTMFALALRVSKSRWTAFAAGLIYSSVSMSAWLVPVIARDIGSVWHARRLQALVVYGEGPHVSAMTMLPLALLFWDRVIERPRAIDILLAALTTAAVAMTNWLAAFALTIMIAALLLSRWRWSSLIWVAIIAAAAYCLAMPWLPPSTIAVIHANSSIMGGDYRHIYDRVWLWGPVVLLALALTKFAIRKLPRQLQFAIFFAFFTCLITLGVEWFNFIVVPQPNRYHLEMEMALTLLVAFGAQAILANRSQRTAAIVVAIMIIALIYPIRRERRYSRDALMLTIDITTTTEWKLADWLNRNWDGSRVMMGGSTSFWLNAFSDTPQFQGGFNQGVTDPMEWIALWGLWSDQNAGDHAAEYSVLWLKALGIHAVDMEGPGSTEVYHSFQHPRKFEGVLEPIAVIGGDTLYRVDRPAPLARVVPRSAIVSRAPVNALDVDPLRPYVAALDDPAAPRVDFKWTTQHSMTIATKLDATQAVSIQEAWASGWHATVNGRSVAVLRDAIGLMYIDPGAEGDIEVDLQYDGGPEMRAAKIISPLVLILLIGWSIRAWYSKKTLIEERR